MKFKADALIGFIFCHSLAVLAFFPSFFSWTGVVLLVLGMLAFGVLGINLGFHRLITHRGFTVPLWLEHTSPSSARSPCSSRRPCGWPCIAGTTTMRMTNTTAFTAQRLFMGALRVAANALRRYGSRPLIERYAKDVMRDPLYAMLERRKNGSRSRF